MNQDDDFLEALENCIKINPNYIPALRLMGAYYQDIDIHKANEFYEKLLDLGHIKPGYLLKLALNYQSMEYYP